MAVRPDKRSRSRRRWAAVSTTMSLVRACLTIGISPTRAAEGQTPASAIGDSYAAPVRQASQRFGVAEDWIWSVMRAESGGNPRAVSVVGAMGLMQVMPTTWASMTARYGLGNDPFDPNANILAGTAYLRAMLDRYGDAAAALAAYNAGPARADDWLARRRPLPPETVVYVARIMPSFDMSSTRAAVIVKDWRTAALFIAPPSAPSPDSLSEAADHATGEDTAFPRAEAGSAGRDHAAPGEHDDALFVPPSGPRS